jgi:hypothetical protein
MAGRLHSHGVIREMLVMDQIAGLLNRWIDIGVVYDHTRIGCPNFKGPS